MCLKRPYLGAGDKPPRYKEQTPNTVIPAKAGIHLVCFKLSCLGAGDKPPRYKEQTP